MSDLRIFGLVTWSPERLEWRSLGTSLALEYVGGASQIGVLKFGFKGETGIGGGWSHPRKLEEGEI